MDLKWEYDELFESFMEDYNSYKKNNMSDRESLARTFGEYETVLNQGEMEKAVIQISYGELLLKQSKVLITAKEKTKEDLASINLNKLKMEITDEQFNDLIIRKDVVLQELDEKPLDYCPEVRWYYYEITDEVKEYFKSENLKVLSQVEIVNTILERFKRDCMNTLSENIAIKITLVELLLSHNISLNNIEIIKNELVSFDLNQVGNQLSEDEKLDLSTRIKEVLSKL